MDKKVTKRSLKEHNQAREDLEYWAVEFLRRRAYGNSVDQWIKKVVRKLKLSDLR